VIDREIGTFLDELSARTPTPGGGAASGIAAAMSLALLRMVFGFARKKADADGAERLDAADRRLAELDPRIREMAERDARAFDRVAACYQLPQDTVEDKTRRSAAIQEALVGAMAVPLDALAMIRDLLEVGLPVRVSVRRNIAADFVNAAALALAAAHGCWCNVAVNASYLVDRERASKALDRAARLMQEIRDAHATICTHGQGLL
jgi:formiminotetrahydrofolate cyclodeaminase